MAELSPPGRATVQVVTSPTTVWIVTSQSQRPNKGHVNHREMRGKKKLFSPRAACGAKVARATARRRRRGARVLVSAGAPISHRTQRWLFRALGRQLANGYGSTEACGLTINGVVKGDVECG